MSKNVGTWLFPNSSRDFARKRWVKVTLRSLHLLALLPFLAGPQLGPEAYRLGSIALAATGLGMALVDLWSNGVMLVQLRGLFLGIKLALVAGMVLWPPAQWPLLALILFFSGIVSHASGNIRYYSPFYRKRLENWADR